MEEWRRVWREGLAPVLSTRSLEALRRALEADDARLLQGATTLPPPLYCVRDWPAEGACALGFCGWQGEGLVTVEEVEAFFARICFTCDQRFPQSVIHHFVNWFDETPRDEMRPLLLAEVNRSLAERAAASETTWDSERKEVSVSSS